MLLRREKQTALSLRDRLARATQVTAELYSAVAAAVRVRVRLDPSRDAARARRLIEAEAWTDAALALIDAALPHWKVTRLAFDDGQWFCRVSKHWQLPDWVDDLVEIRHEVLPLAILSALLEAYQSNDRHDVRRTVPRVPERFSLTRNSALCDNFR
jgi:hypothetical protein